MSKDREPVRPRTVSLIAFSYGLIGILAYIWGARMFIWASISYFTGLVLDIAFPTPLPAPLNIAGIRFLPIAGIILGAGLAAVLGAVGLYRLKGWGWWLTQEATMLGLLLYGYATLAPPLEFWGLVPMAIFAAVAVYLHRTRILFQPTRLTGATVVAVIGLVSPPVVGWITMGLGFPLHRSPIWAHYALSLLYLLVFIATPFAYWEFVVDRIERLD